MESTFSARLKEARTIKAMKQKDLAEKIDVNTATIGRWERGEHPASQADMEVLALHLGVSKDWLISGEGPMVLTAFQMLGKIGKELGMSRGSVSMPTGSGKTSIKQIINTNTVSPSRQILRNVLLDADDRDLTNDEAVQLALAIQEALRELKR